MRNIQLREADGKKLREQFPNSLFLHEDFDNAVVGVNKNGSIRYHHYELLYAILDINKDEYDGEDYENEKDEFTDEFIDFYDRYDEQLQMEFSQNETQYKYCGSNLIPPVLTTIEPRFTDIE